jgi:protein phosphatase
MGSTLSVVGLVGSRLALAHIGDSRAYHWRAGVLRRVSEDQTWVGQLVAAGQLSEEAARKDPRRHIILQALGTEEDPEVYRAELSLRAGDRLLLCSDGLTELILDKEIEEVLGSAGPPTQQCELLVHWANHRGGVDNITVVIAHLS